MYRAKETFWAPGNRRIVKGDLVAPDDAVVEGREALFEAVVIPQALTPTQAAAARQKTTHDGDGPSGGDTSGSSPAPAPDDSNGATTPAPAGGDSTAAQSTPAAKKTAAKKTTTAPRTPAGGDKQ
ncbi:hypothetical protein ACFWM5_00595 [Streptomyces bobili]|uniref:hypothetical protein n=1 Tax=Streptomyces bobili TaxID=67280 RepID=UPI00364F2AFF